MAWALLAMSRPDQLVAVALSGSLGVAIALAWGSPLEVEPVFVGGLSLLLIAASIHYANEYADYETDALTTRTPFSGGSGALSATGFDRRLAGRAMLVTSKLWAVVTVFAIFLGLLSLQAAAVVALIAVLGWTYSLPPVALAWNGLGEVDNSFLGGIAAPLFGYATVTGSVDFLAVLAVVPFGIAVFLNLLATQWPDREADRTVGKNTLAVRWSPTRLRRVFFASGCLGLASLLVLWETVLPTAVVVGSLISLPFFMWGALTYTRRESPTPTVVGMVVLLCGQLGGWIVLL